MTKETALKCLLDEYPQGGRFEPFFRGVIDRFAGESKIIDEHCFSQIRLYLNNFS